MNSNQLIKAIQNATNPSKIIDLLKQNLIPMKFDTLMLQLDQDYQIELMQLDDSTIIPMWTDSNSGMLDAVSVSEFKSIIIDSLTLN